MNQCEYCGTELPANASFCGNCGQHIKNASQPPGGERGFSPSGANYDPLNAANGDNGSSSPDSVRRQNRRPYQYPSQQSTLQPADEPVIYPQYPQRYPPQEKLVLPKQPDQPQQAAPSHRHLGFPGQQAPGQRDFGPSPAGQYVPPVIPPPVNPNVKPSPSARPGSPSVLPARPKRSPRSHRRRGCLIGCLPVLVLLLLVGLVVVPTLQRVLAFGSAISTQPPLSSQTFYMNTSDRVNILVMGYGGGNHPGANLTDSMMVMSLLPQSHHTTLISVPRDLWVQIPEGSGNYDKINAVYQDGSNNGVHPAGGGDAAAQKVSLVTGLNVKYWVTINFAGFRDFINAIGGVDVYVPDSFNACYPKNDNPDVNASWIKVQFNKGMQHMDGETAIRYARAREPLDVCGMGTSENQAELTDFARSARQQIIIKAALAKVKQMSTWPKLYDALTALQHTVYTNMSLADLAQFALKMDLNGAHRVGLSNQNVLIDSSTSGGEYILVPRNGDWQAVKNYVSQQLYN